MAGTVATLTCTVTGPTPAGIVIVWIKSDGTIYNKTTDNPNYMVTEELGEEGTSKQSTLTLSERVTDQDQVFKCKVTLKNTNPVEIEVPVKTFTVVTTGAEVQSGQSATLTCEVIEPGPPTEPLGLDITWYYEDGQEIIVDVTQQLHPNNSVISKLFLERPRNDANYTCRVEGVNMYNFFAEVVIDDIILNPAGAIRSLTGSELTLTCSFMTNTVSEGFFQWTYNEEQCATVACKNTVETPKSSLLSITVEGGTAGAWKCSFIKAKNSREVKSEVLSITAVELSGTQRPASLWGLDGEIAEVFCGVPDGLNFSKLTDIEWILDRFAINPEGIGINQNNEVSRYKFGEKVVSATELAWSINFTHSAATVGSLKCRATYETGEQIKTPPSYLNLVTLTSDVTFIVITPGTGASVTFYTRAKEAPTSTIDINSGSWVQSSKEEAITDGILFTEVVKFTSDSVSPVNSREELSMKEYTYTYKVNLGQSKQLSVSGKAFLVGETFLDGAPVWVAIGGRTKLTAYVTALDTSGVRATWEHEVDGEWVDVETDGHFILSSGLDDKNVMSITLVIDKTEQSYITKYRVQIDIAGSTKTTSEVATQSVTAIAPELDPVFEEQPVVFTVSVEGPSKPTDVKLNHEESGKKIHVTSVSSSSSKPYEISHQLSKVYAGDQGSYSFTVQFDSGLTFESNKVQLSVKQKCKPLTKPQNTQLSESVIAGSSHYMITVTCVDNSYILMNDSQTEAVCNTDSGLFDTTDLSPCLRTVDPIEDPEEEDPDDSGDSGDDPGDPSTDSGDDSKDPSDDSSSDPGDSSTDSGDTSTDSEDDSKDPSDD